MGRACSMNGEKRNAYRILVGKQERKTTLLDSDILLSTLLSNTLSLCSSLNIRGKVSHPYRTTGKSIVLYILIFVFLDSRREDKTL
jgi:hypothetical protein